MSLELDVPDEIIELFDEVSACNQCRDACIRSLFKAKRAIYYSKQSIRATKEAWKKVHELWPQTETGTWQYNPVTMKLVMIKP